MAITLDTIALDDLLFLNEFEFSGVDSRVEQSLGGTPIIWEQEKTGKPIDLVGDDQSGWLTRQDVTDLMALAMVPNGQYPLNYEGRIFNVRFRNEDPPVISVSPVKPMPNSDPLDYYNNVQIKLMEV